MTERTEEIIHRLNDLETRAAHLERMTEDLSEVTITQHKIIEQMTLQMQMLMDRLIGLELGWEASPQDGKPPPHY